MNVMTKPDELTEDELLYTLQETMRRYPTQRAFREAHKLHAMDVWVAVSYQDASRCRFSDSLLRALGARRVVTVTYKRLS